MIAPPVQSPPTFGRLNLYRNPNHRQTPLVIGSDREDYIVATLCERNGVESAERHGRLFTNAAAVADAATEVAAMLRKIALGNHGLPNEVWREIDEAIGMLEGSIEGEWVSRGLESE